MPLWLTIFRWKLYDCDVFCFQLGKNNCECKIQSTSPFIQFQSPRERITTNPLKYKTGSVSKGSTELVKFFTRQFNAKVSVSQTKTKDDDENELNLPVVPHASGCALPKFLKYAEFDDDESTKEEPDPKIARWYVNVPDESKLISDKYRFYKISNPVRLPAAKSSNGQFENLEDVELDCDFNKPFNNLSNQCQVSICSSTTKTLPIIKRSDSSTRIFRNRVDAKNKMNYQQFEVASQADRKSTNTPSNLPQPKAEKSFIHLKSRAGKHSTWDGRDLHSQKSGTSSTKYVILPFSKKCKKLNHTQTEKKSATSARKHGRKIEVSQSKLVIMRFEESAPSTKSRKKKKPERVRSRKAKAKDTLTEKSVQGKGK